MVAFAAYQLKQFTMLGEFNILSKDEIGILG